MRWLFVLLFLSACTRALDTPIENGCPGGCGVAEPTCDVFSTAEACNAQSGCYALLTYDEPCNSSGCASHFASCEVGPALCDQAPCPDTGGNFGCDGTTSYAYAEGGCAIGCVDTSKCDAK